MSGKAVIRATQVGCTVPSGRTRLRVGSVRGPAKAVTVRRVGRWPPHMARSAPIGPPGRPALPACLFRPLLHLNLQMFTKNGQASRVSLMKEIVIGSAIGTVLGLYWQT